MTKEDRLFEMNRRQFLLASGAAVSTAWVLGACDSENPHGNNGNNVNNLPDADVDGDTGDLVDADADADADAEVPLPRPITTVRETIVGQLEALPHFEDLRSLFGVTRKGPGEPHIERDDLGAAAAATGQAAVLSSLAYFAHMTDIHIVDEESPARSIHSPIASASAWRPHEPWSVHNLNAVITTINAFAEVRPHDFIVFSGDLTDNKHFVELDWFLRVMEGLPIDPDTGSDQDPLPSGQPDPHDPFTGVGLHPAVKWYCVQGNHDLLVLGNFDTMSFAVADPTGSSATVLISDSVVPTCFDDPVCVGGFCYSETPARCHIPFSDDYYTTRSLVADPDRRFIDRVEWIQMVMGATRNGPPGHGFNNDNVVEGRSYWVDPEPVPGLPVALVGLDTSSAGGVAASADGYMPQAELDWLQETLDDLVAADKLVVIISHHCARDVGDKAATLVAMLNACPNVVLHITGHHHTHEVYPHPAPSGQEPWHGYWEVQNCGLLDWPQQMRFWELVDRGDGTGVIYATIVDSVQPEGSVVAGCRFYALADVQEGRSADGEGPGLPEARHVALRIAWPPAMIPGLAALPKRDVETLHFYDEGR